MENMNANTTLAVETTTAPAVDYSKRKDIRNTAAAVGSALSGADKYAAAEKRRNQTTNPRVKCLLAAYMGGNSKPMKAAALTDTHAETGIDGEHYAALANCVFLNAVQFNNAPAAVKSADRSDEGTALFTALKEYFAFFNNDFTADNGEKATVKVTFTRDDLFTVSAMVSGVITEKLTCQGYTRNDGTTAARTVTAIKSNSNKDLPPFLKELERLTAERLMDFDGVVSVNRSRDIRKANKATADAAIKGYELVKAAAPVETAPVDTAAPAKKSKNKKTAA